MTGISRVTTAFTNMTQQLLQRFLRLFLMGVISTLQVEFGNLQPLDLLRLDDHRRTVIPVDPLDSPAPVGRRLSHSDDSPLLFVCFLPYFHSFVYAGCGYKSATGGEADARDVVVVGCGNFYLAAFFQVEDSNSPGI